MANLANRNVSPKASHAMSTPFIYDKYVTGKDFLGRTEDAKILGNLLGQREHVAIYEPPKTGKKSVIQQALFDASIRGSKYLTGQFSLMNIRSLQDFLVRFGTTAVRTAATTPGEYADIVSRHLAGTHFVFDRKEYADRDALISVNWEPDAADMAAMLRLPMKLAKESGKRMVLILDEFQNIEQTGEGDSICKELEKVMDEMSASQDPGCCFIFCGSMVNAMKEIFEVKCRFYHKVTRLQLRAVEEKIIIEHIVKGFLLGGKIIERELLLGTCRLFRNNLWYINHFISICDSLSKGYIVESTLMEALGAIISIHEPRFIATMNSLTTFQVNMLKAILDGVNRFSSSEVIQKYGLSSSANVRRLKDALMKKEIVTFNEKDEASLEDPLFEYWVRKYYFEMN